jgi:hypothetical protein
MLGQTDSAEGRQLIPKKISERRGRVVENLAEGVGFEPTVRLPVRLISSQVPLTTQPPFRILTTTHSDRLKPAQ